MPRDGTLTASTAATTASMTFQGPIQRPTVDDIVAMMPELRRYARQLTRDDDKTNDLVQHTVMQAIDKLEHYNPTGSFKGWVFTIARNKFFDERRHAQRHVEVSFAEDVHLKRSHQPEQQTRLLLNEAARALAALPKHQRDVLGLVVFQGMSYEGAARKIGVAVGTVRSRIFRARTTLLAALGADDRMSVAEMMRY